MNFWSFAKAREYVHTLNLKSSTDWRRYIRSGRKPADIPSAPYDTYNKDWKGWGDWLGTNTKRVYYLPFHEAKKLVHTFKLKSEREWRNYIKLKKKPQNIPSNPQKVYRKQWMGMGDWLGTGTIAPQKMKFRSYEDARRFVHLLGLKNQNEWHDYCESGVKPDDIPSNPNQVYKRDWKGFGDWLGTGTVAPKNMEFRGFEEAKKFVHSLRLRSHADWLRYCRLKEKPKDIPTSPTYVYKEQWKGWGDWLGTGAISTMAMKFMPFEDARNFVHSLGLKSQTEWDNYRNSDARPSNIPSNPGRTYKDKWISYSDWLGYEEKVWSVQKVKTLLHDLIKSGIIYQWDEAVLYSFLLRRGVLNLIYNRHTQFFKNLIEASRTVKGRKVIEGYANSDSQMPPDLSKVVAVHASGIDEEIQKASSQELSQLVEDDLEPLDYGEIKTAEQILANTNILESISVDEEAMQFYIDYSVDELWKAAFRDKEETILAVRSEGENGNNYHDTVIETFLLDYQGTQNIVMPNGYARRRQHCLPYPFSCLESIELILHHRFVWFLSHMH